VRRRQEIAIARARRINSNREVRVLARVGLWVSGLVHLAYAGIAVALVLGQRAHADAQGVLGPLLALPGGLALIWAAGLALLGLAFWQWTDAAWESGPRLVTVVGRRLADLAKAVGFAAVGVGTIAVAFSHPGSASAADRFSRWLLATPGGSIVLVLAACVAAGVAVAHLVAGFSRNTARELARPSGWRGVAIRVLAIVGHLGKGVAFMLIAILLFFAGVLARADLAGGLDEALHYVARLPSGAAMLLVIAVGLSAYGLYLIARARFLPRTPATPDFPSPTP
jgi:hypothetical protein